MRITNAVLAERIKNVHTDVKDIKADVRINTEFRITQEATQSAPSGMGAGLLLLLQKIFRI